MIHIFAKRSLTRRVDIVAMRLLRVVDEVIMFRWSFDKIRLVELLGFANSCLSVAQHLVDGAMLPRWDIHEN